MLDLESAIKHCEEVADEMTKQGKCAECAEEHRQLAEWLKELKKYREPQKPEYIADGYSDGELVYDMAKCPNCGNDDYEYDYGNWGKPFCPECGQALDWSEEE